MGAKRRAAAAVPPIPKNTQPRARTHKHRHTHSHTHSLTLTHSLTHARTHSEGSGAEEDSEEDDDDSGSESEGGEQTGGGGSSTPYKGWQGHDVSGRSTPEPMALDDIEAVVCGLILHFTRFLVGSCLLFRPILSTSVFLMARPEPSSLHYCSSLLAPFHAFTL